jgi:TRAP-type uncharacterized transport system substrate-binding protein
LIDNFASMSDKTPENLRMQEINELLNSTTKSLSNSLTNLNQINESASDSAMILSKQRQQMLNQKKKLDEIDDKLKQTDKLL